MKIKLHSLLTGIWSIFGNCFDIFVKYCLVGIWSCVFKNGDFHICVHYSLSSCNTTCKCLHKHVISVFDIFWVTSKYSDYGLHGCDTLKSQRWLPIFWWNLVPSYSGLTLNMLVHIHVVFTTGKGITWTLTTMRIWELTHQNSFFFYVNSFWT